MDEDMELYAPENTNVEGNEAEVPEDELPENDADSDDADEADGDVGEEESSEPVQKGRAANRIQTLRNREKEALTKAEKAEQEVAALRRQMEDVQRRLHTGTIQQDAAARQAALEAMDPYERVRFEADEKFNTLQRELQQVKMSAADSTDRANFLSKANVDPTRAELAAKVETELANMREKNLNAPREDIYYYLLGKSLAEKKAKSGGKTPEKQAARARVEQTQGRSSSARSDAASGGRKGKTAEERLDGIVF